MQRMISTLSGPDVSRERQDGLGSVGEKCGMLGAGKAVLRVGGQGAATPRRMALCNVSEALQGARLSERMAHCRCAGHTSPKPFLFLTSLQHRCCFLAYFSRP